MFKIKLRHRPFNTAYSGIYSGSLDGMPPILVFKVILPPLPCKLLPGFED